MFKIWHRYVDEIFAVTPNRHNPKSHQRAVFNSLVYRLFNTLLEQTEYTKEYEYILNITVTNGFDEKLVDKKITTFRKLKHIKETTTLSTLVKDVTRREIRNLSD